MAVLGVKNARVNFKKADSKSKEYAFRKAHELNQLEKWERVNCCKNEGCHKCKGTGVYYKRVVWRVGKNTDKQVIVEIDFHDEFNLALVKAHLEQLLNTKFNCVKTSRGYHLISKKLFDKNDWIYAHAKVLNPELKREYLQDYIKALVAFDAQLREQNRTNVYKKEFEKEIKKSGLFFGVGKFDVLYTYLSIKYEKSTLRISKKHENDKYELVQ